MDYEQDFLATVTETVNACKSRGKATRTWEGKGQKVTGWSLGRREYTGPATRGNPGRPGAWFEEIWGHWETILGETGEFWEYSFFGYDGTDYPNGSKLEHGLGGMSLQSFVGQKGKPFSEWKAKLERLPYS